MISRCILSDVELLSTARPFQAHLLLLPGLLCYHSAQSSADQAANQHEGLNRSHSEQLVYVGELMATILVGSLVGPLSRVLIQAATTSQSAKTSSCGTFRNVRFMLSKMAK